VILLKKQEFRKEIRCGRPRGRLDNIIKTDVMGRILKIKLSQTASQLYPIAGLNVSSIKSLDLIARNLVSVNI
jgi:hypothetical protein